MVPSRTRSVSWAIAPRSTQGSCASTVPSQLRWSQRKKPSHPDASARVARATTAAGSVNGGTLSPNRIRRT